MFLTSGPDETGVEALSLCTLGPARGLYIPHVTGKRMSGVLRAGVQCTKNNHDVCSAGRCHCESITSKACALSGFAFFSSCGSALCHPTPA